MTYIKPFSQISKGDATIAGGKGASLGEMTQAGIPVPPGFVILAPAFQKFLEDSDINIEIDSILKTVDINAMHTVENASAQIQALILEEKAISKELESQILASFEELDAEFVAVRSSATAEDSASAAWAGQLDSYLNTTEATLLENVRRCWASLFTPRAIFYRFEKQLDQIHISVAVVVQKMVNSDAAGIAFSVHPVTEDRNQIIIEAALGLGEAVVSGQITPDSYITTKNPRAILDKNIVAQTRGLFRKIGGGNEWKDIEKTEGDEQVLSDELILILADTVQQIEKHYEFPCDIEWAMEDGTIYIVQSRPITTLSEQGDVQNDVPFKKYPHWSKNWYSKFSLLACDIGLKVYLTFDKLFGKCELMPIVVHQKGYSSCFYVDEHLDEFTSQLWKLYSENPALLDDWIRDAKSATDKFAELMKEDDALGAFATFTKCVDDFGGPNFAVREITNRLDPHEHPDEVEKVTEYRKYTELYYYHMDTYLDKVYALVSDKTGYSKKQIQSLTLPEFFAYLKNETLPKKEVLQSRYDKSVSWFVGDEWTYYDGDIDEAVSILQGTYDGSGTFRGVKAYGGKTTGRVKKITSYDPSVVITSDEILVTGMTDPRYIHLMHTARGFITDAGGMLSHAAIVARELQKPCIVGTKVATKVLNDGDMVEVDADNGLVKILTPKADAPYFNKENSVFTFESKGTSFLFEDIVASHYMNWPSLTLGNNGVVRVYVPKDEVSRLNEVGSSLTNTDVAKRANGVKAAAKYMEVELPDLQKKQVLTRDDAVHVFQRLAELCKDYSYFDIHYSDGMWKSIEHDPEAKRNVDLVQQYKNEIRDLLNMPFFTPDGWLATTLNILSKQFNIPTESLNWYREKEILALFDQKFVSEQDIAERQKSYALYVDKGHNRILFSGDKAGQLQNEFEIDTNAVGTYIKGIVAHGKGKKVQGRVKIIKRDYSNPEIAKESMNAMEKGDILVSETTDPSLMEALKKAAAIVTDVGGMLSHAAITARELDTPCIIGTEIASKVLKDGDLVEIDADNGIVTVLKSAATVFEKVYTRDTTVIMQEAWGECCSEGIEEFFGKNPHRPEIIHFINEGSIEIWENRLATQWLMDAVLGKSISDPTFTRKIAEKYQSQVAALKSYWDKKYLENLSELPIYFNKIKEALTNFIVYYYSAVDDRTPKNLRDEMLKIRDADTFFATSDAFIRDTLLHHHPKIRGFETTILLKEIMSIPTMTELQNRRKHMTLIDGIERTTESLEQLHIRHPEYVFKIEQNESQVSSEIRGQVAQTGMATGRVRILRRRDQIDEVLEGEIIVSPMTTPDFLPAMQKAAAFVTDEGGITCHAGIVARELKKPCVIGTKNATQIFKTGDLVEVNANTGVVRILEG